MLDHHSSARRAWLARLAHDIDADQTAAQRAYLQRKRAEAIAELRKTNSYILDRGSRRPAWGVGIAAAKAQGAR